MLVLVVVAALIVYLIIKDKDARETVSYNTSEENVVVEGWDDDDDSEGDLGGIVTYEYTETLPADVDGEITLPGETAVTTAAPDEESESTEVSETDSYSEETEETEEESEEATSYLLEYNGHSVSTSVQWNNVSAQRKGDNNLSYTIGDTNVSLSLTGGSREAYKEVILNKAESLGAEITDEVFTYSPTRVYDMYEYDKYTLTYYKNEDDSEPSVVYYFVSDAGDGLVYLVTISSSDYINSDSDVFGILEYYFY